MDKEARICHLQSLYKVFAATSNKILPRPTMTHSRKGCLRRFLQMPVVYASETTEDSDTKTTMDKLHDGLPSVVVSDADIMDYLSKETGRDRLRDMFTFTGDRKEPHVELGVVVNAARGGFFVMTFVGWVIGSRMAKQRFLEKSARKKYESKFRALRAHSDAKFLGGAKHGLKLGFKTATFIGIFLLISQTISVYRNKSSPLEYTTAGVLTGSLFRLNMGLRGMAGGGFLGGFLGTVGGILMYTTMNLASDKMEDRHYRRIEEQIRNKRLDELVKLPPIESASNETNTGLPS